MSLVAKRNGYDLPLFGIDDHKFYAIHIPALICILLSLVSVILVLYASFRDQRFTKFFSWTKCERFVVYIAICDGMYNICHSMDHIHILTTMDHVKPKQLCEFYGFNLIVFITAQILMVNIVAINAFVLVYFRKKLNFGEYDWKLLLWMFGVSLIAASIALGISVIGPNGAA